VTARAPTGAANDVTTPCTTPAAAVAGTAVGVPVPARGPRKARPARKPTPAPDATRPRPDLADASARTGELPLVGIDDEMRVLFAQASRVVSHVDADGHQFVAASARLSPDDVEAIAQRLAGLFLRGG
jgi:hypothetical protein